MAYLIDLTLDILLVSFVPCMSIARGPGWSGTNSKLSSDLGWTLFRLVLLGHLQDIVYRLSSIVTSTSKSSMERDRRRGGGSFNYLYPSPNSIDDWSACRPWTKKEGRGLNGIIERYLRPRPLD